MIGCGWKGWGIGFAHTAFRARIQFCMELHKGNEINGMDVINSDENGGGGSLLVVSS